MVIEAIRRTYWTDESLETIAKVLDWKQFSPAKRQTRKPREKQFSVCVLRARELPEC